MEVGHRREHLPVQAVAHRQPCQGARRRRPLIVVAMLRTEDREGGREGRDSGWQGEERARERSPEGFREGQGGGVREKGAVNLGSARRMGRALRARK